MKCKNLEAELSELQKDSNKLQQYTKRNNLEKHGIPVEGKDDQFKQKVFDFFSKLNISIYKSDIEDCHQLGKSNTIARVINRKFCKDVLNETKLEVNKRIDNSKFVFSVETNLF